MENNNDDFFDIDPQFLKQPPKLEPLPELRGQALDFSDMPQTEPLNPDVEGPFLRAAGIRFGRFGRVYDYDVGTLRLNLNEPVVADVAEKGIMMGWVARTPIRIDNSVLKLRLPKVGRAATEEDISRHHRAVQAEENGMVQVKKHIGQLNLPMQPLRVEFTLDMRKALVYFAAENRVDFRDLLKELVHDLKAKVELRQVGVRDHAKLTGGLGPCGEELCCSKFLNKFHAVNIKMAKDQNLSLKPTKVSGMCGRLKCCLQYEQDAYRDALKGLPSVGKKVKCSKGCGVVTELEPLKQMVTVLFDDGTRAKVDAKDVVSESTLKGESGPPAERMVATTDQGSIIRQIQKIQKVQRPEKIEATKAPETLEEDPESDDETN